MQDKVAVWGEDPKATLAGRVHVRPAGVDGETERVTVPVNPNNAFRVMVEVPGEPAEIWGLGETDPAEMEKSGGLPPVTVTVIVRL